MKQQAPVAFISLCLTAALIASQASAAPATATASTDFRLPVWPSGAATPTFELIDVHGQTRTLHDYAGKVVIVFFGFTHCPDACPTELFKLAAVMKRLGAAAARVQVLFITLDPERDSPKVLDTYVQAFDARFVGLTGSAAQIDQAARAFFVEYARVPQGADYVIDHSTRIAVIDRAGQLRLIGPSETRIDDLTHDIGILADAP